MLRRLEKRILVDLPSQEARRVMIQHWLPPLSSSGGVKLRTDLDYSLLSQVGTAAAAPGLGQRPLSHRELGTHLSSPGVQPEGHWCDVELSMAHRELGTHLSSPGVQPEAHACGITGFMQLCLQNGVSWSSLLGQLSSLKYRETSSNSRFYHCSYQAGSISNSSG